MALEMFGDPQLSLPRRAALDFALTAPPTVAVGGGGIPVHVTEDGVFVLRAPDRTTEQGRRDHSVLLFLYNTGARASEALAMAVTVLVPAVTTTLPSRT